MNTVFFSYLCITREYGTRFYNHVSLLIHESLLFKYTQQFL